METNNKPDLAFIARQLRKPSGAFAPKIAEKMNQVNGHLHEVMLDTMELADHERVLEIGFGSGKFFNNVFSRAKALQVDGIDHSEEMVNSAKSINQAMVASGKLNLQRASSDHLPFPNDTFDKVFCNMVIYFWENPEIHLKEIHRVLRSGGRFYSGIRSKEAMLQLPFSAYGFVLYTEEEWKKILTDNGFSCIGTCKENDPPIESFGHTLHMESICCIAEKIG